MCRRFRSIVTVQASINSEQWTCWHLLITHILSKWCNIWLKLNACHNGTIQLVFKSGQSTTFHNVSGGMTAQTSFAAEDITIRIAYLWSEVQGIVMRIVSASSSQSARPASPRQLVLRRWSWQAVAGEENCRLIWKTSMFPPFLHSLQGAVRFKDLKSIHVSEKNVNLMY